MPWQAAGLVALFAALFWNVYAYERFAPVAPDYRAAALPMALGGLLLGGGFLLATLIGHRRERRRQEAANRQAAASGQPLEFGASSFWGQRGVWALGLTAVIVAGALFLGALTALVWTWTANALLDDGEPRTVEVEVLRVENVTESFVFRRYLVVYRFPDSREEIEYSAGPGELARFSGPTADAEMMPGRFGWPWVRRLRPVERRSATRGRSRSAGKADPAPAIAATSAAGSPRPFGPVVVGADGRSLLRAVKSSC